ncbi:MAG TPA: SDR family oxidoreductase [Propionibacteriaceae bacterium]
MAWAEQLGSDLHRLGSVQRSLRHGIRKNRAYVFNALAPGYFETELTRALVEDNEFSAWVRGRTPAGRWGKVEDLIGALVFLASPASDFVNGQVLFVDGGMTAVV